GRAHVGPRVGCARGAPRTLYGGRPAAVSDGPRATQPKRGDGPTEDHAEGAVAEEPAVTPGRPGAALSGIASVLALSRTVEKNTRRISLFLYGVTSAMELEGLAKGLEDDYATVDSIICHYDGYDSLIRDAIRSTNSSCRFGLDAPKNSTPDAPKNST